MDYSNIKTLKQMIELPNERKIDFFIYAFNHSYMMDIIVGDKNDREVYEFFREFFSTFSDEELIKAISPGNVYGLTLGDVVASFISGYIKDDKKKMDFLDKYKDSITNDAKFFAISLLQSDELKVQILHSETPGATDTYLVIESIKDDNIKTQLIDEYIEILDAYKLSRIISSMKSDESKIDAFTKYDSYLTDYYRSDVLSTMDDDDYKIKIIDERFNKDTSYYYVKIISSIKDEAKRYDCFVKYIDSMDAGTQLSTICGFSADNILKLLKQDGPLKSRFNYYLYNELEIIKSITDDSIKVMFLMNQPEYGFYPNEEEKIAIIESLTDDTYKIEFLKPTNKYNMTLNNETIWKLIVSLQDNTKLELADPNNKYGVVIEGLTSYVIREILNGNIMYNENSSKYLKDNYPELFVDDNLPEQLKNKFYEKGFLLEDFEQDSSLIEMFNNTNIALAFSANLSWVSLLFENEDIPSANSHRLGVIKEYNKIEDTDLSIIFKNYLLENEFDVTQLSQITEVLQKILLSNSKEIYNFRNSVARQVLNNEDSMACLEKLESIFVKNNLPMAGKLFMCFKTLYPDFSKKDHNGKEIFDFSEFSRVSPELLYASPRERIMQAIFVNKLNREEITEEEKESIKKDIRFQIVFNDLLQISARSGCRSLVKYINNLEEGNDLYVLLTSGEINFSNLGEEQKKVLETFVSHLETMHNNSKDGELDDLRELSLEEKLKVLSKEFISESRYSLADRVIRRFGYSAGFKSLSDLKETIVTSLRETDARGRKYEEELKDKKFKLEPGDFIRCIGTFEAVGGSLDIGNVCKEFLGPIVGKSDSDTTPLDVDITLIEEDKGSAYANIDGGPTGWGFGNIFIVLKKDNPRLSITRDKDGKRTNVPYDPTKVELFGTAVANNGYKTHWGARTGLASTDIDVIMYKKNMRISSDTPYKEDGSVNYEGEETEYDDLPAIKFEIAKKGFYIPIVDLSGNLIFTSQEFEQIRSRMQGLSYYGMERYDIDIDSLHFSKITVDDTIIPGIEETIYEKESDCKRVEERTKVIRNYIIRDLTSESLGLEIDSISQTLDDDISDGRAELFVTGSTARGTNVPGDSDFDYMLKLDRRIISSPRKVNAFTSKLSETFPGESVPGKANRFRRKKVSIPDFPENLEVDVSIEQKKSNITYSTDMALSERLESIKKQHPDEYPLVVANIVFAKRFLKAKKVYKATKSDASQGGLGGIGVENWVLQNGGSFVNAAKDFLKHARKDEKSFKSFKEFKSDYHIWDFGENHEPRDKKISSDVAVTYPHDEFISDSMNEEGYNKMIEALQEYILTYEQNKSEIETVSL